MRKPPDGFGLFLRGLSGFSILGGVGEGGGTESGSRAEGKGCTNRYITRTKIQLLCKKEFGLRGFFSAFSVASRMGELGDGLVDRMIVSL